MIAFYIFFSYLFVLGIQVQKKEDGGEINWSNVIFAPILFPMLIGMFLQGVFTFLQKKD